MSDSDSRGPDEGRTPQDWIADRVLRILIWLMLRLPYGIRVPLMGAVTRRLVSPLAGYQRRALDNLSYIFPEMPAAERRRIAHAVSDNIGRTLIENYSTTDFLKRTLGSRIEGPGLEYLKKARREGRPVVLVTGHFGNYEAPRATLTQMGFIIGGLYRPMNNAFFNEHYVGTMERIGGPVFPRGRKGLAGLVKHVRGGGFAVLLIDQFMYEGEPLDFMGKPAPTALSAAEMALKYDALLVPFYGIRNPDGLSFTIAIEAPVAPSDPASMTQKLNDSLAAQVRARPEQWLWVHRRWKPHRQSRRAAASTGPNPSS